MIRPRTGPTVLLAVAAIVLYALLWVGNTQHWGWLNDFDWSLLNAAHDVGIKHPMWVRFWDVVSIVLGPIPLRSLGLMTAAISLVWRQLRMAGLLLVCLPLNGFVTMAAKDLADRPRPATALVAATSTSFPSGHALQGMASALALLTLLMPLMKRPPMRVVAVAVAAVGVLLVGIARVALNVHHPSDVIAGWALGYLYFLVCLWVFRPVPITLRCAPATSRRSDPTGSQP
ncbi:phosphatase PAP2 family protein [Mycobacterium shinjukuense]|uniref:Membrane protein n=1 Tax=Mycobacterium shinjukuense TaxID=398694 RepID=A0A7I7MSW0_9MYCO|nr:phosphatase PAP2 family protein [Mycobacterium shinjukuense]MCV6986229.1 phosphatase PAP2 family protein [Mycobacterium shinjukuense]ORB72253.1 phosphatase PAP2 family protein [Mycobacterium shinjukuense]BBX75275.1 membrane protein [Mycobacterium shinjukuense]